jgi:hypothetical protein
VEKNVERETRKENEGDSDDKKLLGGGKKVGGDGQEKEGVSKRVSGVRREKSR